MKRIYSFFLIFISLLLVVANIFISSKSNISGFNIEKLSEDSAIIHYDNCLNPTPDLLFVKEKMENEFNYKILDNKTKKEHFNFKTNQNISFENTHSFNNINCNNCALAWAIFHAIKHHRNPAAEIGNLFGAGIAVAVEGTLPAIISLIASEGILSIPAVIGLLSGLEAVIVALGVGGIA